MEQAVTYYPLTWLADELRVVGLSVSEVSGWKTRGYDPTRAFYGNRGVLLHHTASPLNTSDVSALNTIVNGRSDLPGPLSQLMIGRDLKVYVVAAGRANHAGLGGPIRDIPLDDGNTYLPGIEVVNDGVGEKWSEALLDVMAACCAVILKHEGRDEASCIGHKEYAPTRKIDPDIDMDAFRLRVKGALGGGDTDMTPDDLYKSLSLDAATMGNALAFTSGQHRRRHGDKRSDVAKDGNRSNTKLEGWDSEDDLIFLVTGARGPK